LFDVAGCQRRVLASSYGSYFCAVAPTRSVDEATWGYPTPDGLERLVEAGDITRLGPVRRDR
jgi:hypothetical protein